MKFLTLVRAWRQRPIGSGFSPEGPTVGITVKRLSSVTAASMVVLASCLMFASTSAAATRVFYDGFESGSFGPSWTFGGTYCPATIVSSSKDGVGPHSGTKMVEGNWDGTVPWTNACPLPSPNTYATLSSWDYTSEFLLRFWARYDTDVDHVIGNKLMRMGDIPDQMYMGAQMEFTGGPLFIHFLM